jgi:hypothetical protein
MPSAEMISSWGDCLDPSSNVRSACTLCSSNHACHQTERKEIRKQHAARTLARHGRHVSPVKSVYLCIGAHRTDLARVARAPAPLVARLRPADAAVAARLALVADLAALIGGDTLGRARAPRRHHDGDPQRKPERERAKHLQPMLTRLRLSFDVHSVSPSLSVSPASTVGLISFQTSIQFVRICRWLSAVLAHLGVEVVLHLVLLVEAEAGFRGLGPEVGDLVVPS